MTPRIVIDGNAFYEIDEDCMRRKKKQQEREEREKRAQAQMRGWKKESGRL